MSTVATLLTAIGYRLGGGIAISPTSDPSRAICIQWLNETALWIAGICAENSSDLGRIIGTITTIIPSITAATQACPCAVTSASHGLVTGDEICIKNVVGMTELNDTEFTFTKVDADSGTLGIDSSAYTAYVSGGTMYKRKYNALASALYVPAQEGWIVKDYSRDKIDLTTEKILVDYSPIETTKPSKFYVDGSNNICFPSYPDDAYTIKIPYWQLPTALTDPENTVPFLGIMDNVFIEAATWRAQNRDEYDITMELKWMVFLNERAQRAIAMRKKTQVGVGL